MEEHLVIYFRGLLECLESFLFSPPPRIKAFIFFVNLRNMALILLLRFACRECHRLQLGAKLSGLSLHQKQQGDRTGRGQGPITPSQET